MRKFNPRKGLGRANVSSFLFWIIVLLALTIIISLKILREDERLVIIRFGRLFKIAGPAVVIIPFINRGIKINLSKGLPGWRGCSELELRAFVLHKHI
jgi:regulator of protease activity HflC (stomatin/prohibitin superfamily)